eukprot:CAMPEP_0168427990 /NCGR_PEP_ID=MMETSP0228-20121227/36630_1 /TAXON_ID=133427 /ORGANISM="Protoceratium reticulatum, Strain CCCM 535 (=CCMP 1889)" /LENGTH=251 /DNA_ID=CAMNT_0008442043 /DNA_START=1 /DNA_END=754 /DNA_ORIENTATION=+
MMAGGWLAPGCAEIIRRWEPPRDPEGLRLCVAGAGVVVVPLQRPAGVALLRAEPEQGEHPWAACSSWAWSSGPVERGGASTGSSCARPVAGTPDCPRPWPTEALRRPWKMRRLTGSTAGDAAARKRKMPSASERSPAREAPRQGGAQAGTHATLALVPAAASTPWCGMKRLLSTLEATAPQRWPRLGLGAAAPSGAGAAAGAGPADGSEVPLEEAQVADALHSRIKRIRATRADPQARAAGPGACAAAAGT